MSQGNLLKERHIESIDRNSSLLTTTPKEFMLTRSIELENLCIIDTKTICLQLELT